MAVCVLERLSINGEPELRLLLQVAYLSALCHFGELIAAHSLFLRSVGMTLGAVGFLSPVFVPFAHQAPALPLDIFPRSEVCARCASCSR
jgi:hypothetical protein